MVVEQRGEVSPGLRVGRGGASDAEQSSLLEAGDPLSLARPSQDLQQPLGPFHGNISVICPGVTSPGSQPDPPCPPGRTAEEQRTISGRQQQLTRGCSPTNDISHPAGGPFHPSRGAGSRLTALTGGSWEHFPSKAPLRGTDWAQLCSFPASSLPKGRGRRISSLPAWLPGALRKRACSLASE